MATGAARAAEPANPRVGVCSWTWHSSMTNGLTREEFTAAALGFVKADNFSTIEVSVSAPGEQGFFIEAPAAPVSDIAPSPRHTAR